MPDYKHIMIATLGGQPQVITLTLDLLLRRNYPINEIYVVHPRISDPRIQHAVGCLKNEFSEQRYAIDGRSINCRLYLRPLRQNDTEMDDITDEASANGTLDTIYHLVLELKQQQRIVHLSLTGGRRLMSLLAISAAQMNFTHLDHIWHIYSPREFRLRSNEGAIMHATPEDGVRLIEMPFVPWGAYFPHLPHSPHSSSTNAQQALSNQVAQMDKTEQAHCSQVFNDLTPRQRDVLYTFSQGMKRQQVADNLHITLKTVDSHKMQILAACRNAWNMPEDEPLDYTFLRDHFADYFDRYEYTPAHSKTHQKGF
jgi:CRISPR-associated protein Csx14